ncbi:thioesterase family protein [Nocardiopsis composta]|uniref:Acyl-coenzyme A thioesterase PaaI-like protein n=1 Tax=Nocardiopsis composta TaxID=157465 RepID=A0A7W8QLH9_9ACTN|nr:thioesterase family protein [Nocardiopsis composta]MBB5432647.1 acyl-coenzyme A thioesterase PaaI-like protein [Nocardiopsis composta]
MTRFESATEIRALPEAGRYAADLDPGYLIGTAMNGGYLMAVMQRAALAEAAHPHPVSSSYNFLRPAVAGPAEIEAVPLKSGRTVDTVRATLLQDGKPLVTGHIAAAGLESDAEPAYEAAPPELPPLDRCRPYDPRRGRVGDGFLGRVDQFYTERTWRRLRGQDPEPVPELIGYLRPSEQDGGAPADPAAFLPIAVDALPPVVTVFDSWRWAPTVELTWHMRALPAPGPLAFRATCQAVGGGWFDENVELWDVKGRLVAQSRQMARNGC